MTQLEKDQIIDACRHRDTDRTGLYIMVFFCLMNTCSIPDDEDIRHEIDSALDARGITVLETTDNQTEEQPTDIEDEKKRTMD